MSVTLSGAELPRRITLDIAQEDRFQLVDGVYRFVKELSGANLLLQHEVTGLDRVISEEDLVKQLGTGVAKRVRDPRDKRERPLVTANNPELSMDELDGPRGLRARTLRYFVMKFDEDMTARKGHKFLVKFINRLRPAALAKGLTHPVSTSRLIWAINNCGVPGDRQIRYFVSRQGKGCRAKRLRSEIHYMMDRSVEYYWSAAAVTLDDASVHFRKQLLEANRERAESNKPPLKAPKKNETLRKKITGSYCHENYAKKFSKWEADQKFHGVSNHLSATSAGELVVIDHTVLDSFVLIDDQARLPLGKVYLSLAVCVATRAIMAYLVTAEPPSIYTLTTLLKRMNQNRDYMADLYPEIEGKWDSWALPRTVLVDNGWDLMANSTIDALSDIGVEVIYSPIATPQYKAIGERAFHTFNTQLIHKLPGSTPYAIAQRRILGAQGLVADPHKDAAVTLEMMDRLMHMYIVMYENEPHSGVNGMPARLWQESIRRDGRRFIDDIESLDHVLGRVDSCTLSKAGVRFKNMRFHERENVSMLLNDLLRYEAKRSQSPVSYASGRIKVKIKYNPADASRIHVWHPGEARYVTLFNRDAQYSQGLSFWAADQIFKFARAKDMEFVSDEQRLHARIQLQKTWAKVIPEKPLKTSKEARRGLAQEVPTIEGQKVMHAKAPSRIDGLAKVSEIQTDLFGHDRLDAADIPKGALKNPAKQAETRKRNQKAKTQAAREDADFPIKRTTLKLPSMTTQFIPGNDPGWDAF